MLQSNKPLITLLKDFIKNTFNSLINSLKWLDNILLANDLKQRHHEEDDTNLSNLSKKPFFDRLTNSVWQETIFNIYSILFYLKHYRTKMDKLLQKPNESQFAIVFVHGLRGDESNFYMIADAIKANSTTYNKEFNQPHLLTFNTYNDKHIATDTNKLTEYLQSICDQYTKICLVGHSRGGILIQRAFNQICNNNPKICNKFKLISISSPERNIEVVTFADRFLSTLGQANHFGEMIGLKRLLIWLIHDVFKISVAHQNFTKNLEKIPEHDKSVSKHDDMPETHTIYAQTKHTHSTATHEVFVSDNDTIVGKPLDQVPYQYKQKSHIIRSYHAGHMSILQDTLAIHDLIKLITSFFSAPIQHHSPTGINKILSFNSINSEPMHNIYSGNFHTRQASTDTQNNLRSITLENSQLSSEQDDAQPKMPTQ